MRIALDAMGADAAPEVEIEGAVAASLEASHEIILVGDEAVLRPRLDAYSKKGNLRILHASERIGMHESPVLAVRGKKDSSLLVAMRLVKNGEADAIVSAGNTGAVMVAARTVIGPIRGVARSAICQALPTATGQVVVLDLGANVDCSARHLCEFAEMGMAYSTYALGVKNPRVGLLNIGEEEAKGTQVSKEVHRALTAATHVNFVGNVEPKAMYNGAADVVVCDGFIGNVILKTSEAVAGVMGKLMKEKLTSSSMNKLGAVLARSALQDIKETVDPNYHPGAPLLGINGIVIITHGSCTSLGIKNALLGAAIAFENRLNDHIRENIEALRGVEERIGPPPAEEAAS
ncbi:MAG: Phosphate acyltransferase [Candidatus Hydrogenedentota bacterium]|jgi:glycerol-3-phosphate acyltransferase PlsX